MGYDGLTIGIETGDDEALRFMNKGYTSADIIEQCQGLDAAGIHYSFFYLVSFSGAGRGEIGAKLTADICNQIHPTLIGANMLTIYPDSELYREIQHGNWQEEGELEKYKEVWQLRKLRALGINGLSIGAESGDDETLALANKGYTSADILEQCRKLDEAGIEYYFIYMTGLVCVCRRKRAYP